MPQSRHLHSISDNHLSLPTHWPAIPAGIVVPFASLTNRFPFEFRRILYACFIGLISLSCFCVYELADVNKVARLIFGVVDEPNAATEGGFYKPTRL
jgi:hypothetical protein